jgi:tetratricopeptide (TPR) repeat protein
LRGENANRAGRLFEARSAFEQAVKDDSTFALAWYRLSNVTFWNWQLAPARDAAKRAIRFSAQLAKRDQLLVQAALARMNGAAAEVERIYRELVFSYPDDVEAWFGLAQTLFHYNPLHGRSMSECLEPLKIDDLRLNLKAHLATKRGEYAQALACLEQIKTEVWHELAWGSPFYAQTNARYLRAELLWRFGRYEEALSWYNDEYSFHDWINNSLDISITMVTLTSWL